MVAGALFGFFTFGPVTWWLLQQGNKLGQMNRPANIHYTADATEEEIERFRAEDVCETLAFQMDTIPGHGFFQKDARHV